MRYSTELVADKFEECALSFAAKTLNLNKMDKYRAAKEFMQLAQRLGCAFFYADALLRIRKADN